MDFFPYVWLDVAIVHLLCALPLGIVMAGYIHRHISAAACAVVAACLVGLGGAVFLDALRPGLTAAVVFNPLIGSALRALSALALVVAGVLTAMILCRQESRKDTAAMTAVGMALLCLAPATFVGARTRHDIERLGEYLGQSRFGEAQELINGLLVLDAQRQWNGQPLLKVAASIEQVVAELESRVAAPLATGATTQERLQRARTYAMLGQSEAALAVLNSIDGPKAVPEADNLRGTIHENRGDWETALASYVRARSAWELKPASDDRTAGLLRATTGIAYCQRKSGRYAEAQTTYQQVLAMASTADSHFLLAQFYEDAQQADKAREHARQAMVLDPRRYQQQGSKLINKLAVYHFGCLGVFRAEIGRSGQP
jgi:tetratricopeptide (TPR) repeat protein